MVRIHVKAGPMVKDKLKVQLKLKVRINVKIIIKVRDRVQDKVMARVKVRASEIHGWRGGRLVLKKSARLQAQTAVCERISRLARRASSLKKVGKAASANRGLRANLTVGLGFLRDVPS